ncbi:MAG: 16S rRNA (cytosine(1402)-N(4))-methyltransferase RsmH [Tepidisphaeraceae bacterium]
MDSPAPGHQPVLLREVVGALGPGPGLTIFDCTVGRGGHALALSKALGTTGRLVCIDVDPVNLEFARRLLAGAQCEVRFFLGNFADIREVWYELSRPPVQGILADLGVSSNQFSDPQYGLSFSQDMPLDMRLDKRLDRSAADLVNQLSEKALADLLFQLAQERDSRSIARNIVEARRISPILTTERLSALVRSAVASRAARRRTGRQTGTIDPATRTFLALRMAVNRETENLASLLKAAPEILAAGGRLAVISFQSTEDRMVKQAFRSAEQTGLLKVVTKKPVTPSPDEVSANPRSRSAKLRVAQRCPT